MNVVGMDDAEGDWILAVRQVVGPQCLIATSYDLYGKVSKRDDCITWALEVAERGILISDSGGNTTDACYETGVDAELELILGGKLNLKGSQPLPVRGRVLRLHPSENDKQAALQIAGLKVIVAGRRRPYHYVEDFRRLGLEPLNTGW